jgi:cyclic beta-1,2-glucan synthetase
MVHPRGIPWTSHFWSIWGDFRTNTAQFLLTFLLLAHQACLMSDAICRTLYRKLISGKQLLEWVTADDVAASSNHDVLSFFRYMWQVELLTMAAAISILYLRPGAFMAAAPFLLAWTASPLVSWWISRSPATTEHELSEAQVHLIRRVTRFTWRFFESFVNAESNWLPPDNFQEDPRPVLAQRTSPTNIALVFRCGS